MTTKKTSIKKTPRTTTAAAKTKAAEKRMLAKAKKLEGAKRLEELKAKREEFYIDHYVTMGFALKAAVEAPSVLNYCLLNLALYNEYSEECWELDRDHVHRNSSGKRLMPNADTAQRYYLRLVTTTWNEGKENTISIAKGVLTKEGLSVCWRAESSAPNSKPHVDFFSASKLMGEALAGDLIASEDLSSEGLGGLYVTDGAKQTVMSAFDSADFEGDEHYLKVDEDWA